MQSHKLAMLLFAAVCIGCSREVSVHMYDQKALAALEEYRPKYKLNEAGRVVELRLDGGHVNDAALSHVQDLTELETLSLYGSSVTDNALKNLCDLGRLRALGLGKTQISDRGLAHVSRIPNLRWLWISEKTKVTKRGVSALKKACPKLRVYQ